MIVIISVADSEGYEINEEIYISDKCINIKEEINKRLNQRYVLNYPANVIYCVTEKRRI